MSDIALRDARINQLVIFDVEGLRTVFRSSSFWLAACSALVAVFILSLSFSFSAFAIAALGFFAGYLLVKSRSGNQVRSAFNQNLQNADPASSTKATEIFALGRLFEATLDEMREGLLVVDADMRVVASNQAALRVFNRAPGKLKNQRLTELTRNPAVYSAFLDALKGNEKSDVKVETRDAGRRVYDLRVVPLGSGQDKQTSGAIGVFFDITQLEKLERVRQEFLLNVSHELRTPLTAILAFVETLEGGALEDPENSRRFLSIIRKNAARMHTLIDDILELNAIEAGNVSVTAREVDLCPLAQDVVSSLMSKATSREISINNTVASGTLVLADPKRLEQMLTNLVDNAIKFNRAGGRVTIKCDNRERTRILIQDTGEGIPAQHLERLFERFYRVDRARTREVGGTGLGLAIVKHLARAHGGEVRVTSELGQGSIFEIDLPRQVAQNGA